MKTSVQTTILLKALDIELKKIIDADLQNSAQSNNVKKTCRFLNNCWPPNSAGSIYTGGFPHKAANASLGYLIFEAFVFYNIYRFNSFDGSSAVLLLRGKSPILINYENSHL